MKIAFDAKRALNNATGLGNYSRVLLNAFMRDFPEHEYLLFTPGAKDEFLQQLNGPFKLFFPETGFQKSFHPLWRSVGLKKSLQNSRASIYHGLSNEIPFGALQGDCKTVVTIHDLIFLKHREQYPFFDRQIYRLKTRYAARHADKIIAVSQETKNDLIENYKVHPGKIEVIHPGIDPVFFNEDSTQGTDALFKQYDLPRKYILHLGSFFPRKNQRTLIEAFDLIKMKVEENLVLVGSGGGKKNMEELIRKKNLESRTKIISAIAGDYLPSLYRNASVFVYPSLFEGFGIPIAEALASKVPVITTKGACFEESGGRESIYVDPLSAEEIADALLKVLGSEQLKKQMVESGYRHALTMTDSITATITMKLYLEGFQK